MREPKSQTVRLKDEILRALTSFSRSRGMTQQHVVSVGAWFFMSMPPNIREALVESFYEWCKNPGGEAHVPTRSPEFARRVVAVIEAECSKEAAKFAMSQEDEQLLNDAMMAGPRTAEEIGETSRRRKAAPAKKPKTPARRLAEETAREAQKRAKTQKKRGKRGTKAD